MSRIDINTAVLKLKEALATIDSLDEFRDLSSLTVAEAGAYEKQLAELSLKLKALKLEIDPRFKKVSSELVRLRTTSAASLCDTNEYTTANGESLTIGFQSETHETINKKELDTYSGVSSSISFTDDRFKSVYSKSIRRSKKQLKNLYDEGKITKEEYDRFITSTTFSQGFLVFDTNNVKEGGK